jgi:hypothetical protein
MQNRFYLLVLLLAMVGRSQAVELCLAIDASGSISSADFTLQLEGIATSVEDPSIVPQNSTVKISLVQFASSAQVEVASTLVDSQATATALASSIRNIVKRGGGTNIGSGITACAGTFAFTGTDEQIIDVSTDGQSANPIPARDAAIAGGVDVVNALGVGSGINVNQLNDLVWPQPVSTLPAPGFVRIIADFSEFNEAIKAKIRAEVTLPGPAPNSQPIPTMSEWSLILLSLLMMALTMNSRKFRKFDL